MAQQRLEGEKVAPGAQIGDGKGMAKTMRMDLLYPSFLTDLNKHLPKAVAVHQPAIAAKKKWGICLFSILAGCQISPENSFDRFAKEYHPALTTLGTTLNAVLHLYLSCLHIHIPYFQGAQFRGTQSRIQKHQNDRSIPRSCCAPHNELAAVGRFRFLTEIAMLKEQLNLVLGEWLKRFLLELGSRHKISSGWETQIPRTPK